MSSTPTQIPAIVRAMLAACVLLTGAVAQETVKFPENIDDGLGPTRSDSGEIIVKGPDAHTRGTYCDYAVRVRGDFLSLMQIGGRLKYPIIIDLKQAPGNSLHGYPVKNQVITHPKYSPNIRVTLCEQFRFSYLHEELVRFYLMEYALRKHEDAGELLVQRKGEIIPGWLWAGVSEALSFQEGGEPNELFRAVVQSGTIMGVDEILKADPDKMTTLSRAIYRASAGGLVLTLLQQDAGPARMRNFIGQLAVAPQDQEALLRKYFPGLNNSNNSLEKWWTLQAAKLAKPTSLDVLTIAETEAHLERALAFVMLENRRPEPGGDDPADDGERRKFRLFGKRDAQPDAVELPVEQARVTYALADYRSFIERSDSAELLRGSEERLMQLSFRSFPLHRPIIKAYLSIIADLNKRDTKGIDERLAQLAKTRAGLLSSAKMAEDVLNLYEATQIDRPSGAFKDYYKVAEQLEKEKPARTDEISKYLDRVQAEHE